MILETDTNYLIRNKITAHQYTIAKLAREGMLSELKKYLDVTKTTFSLKEDVNALYKAGFTSAPLYGDAIGLTDINITTKFSQSHSFHKDPFEELYDAYPTKVIRPDGSYDYLRVDRKRSRKMYYNIIRENPALHEYILKCLDAEVTDKTNRGKLSFMKRMPTWLASEAWKAYADIVESNSESTLEELNEPGYGQSIE